VRWNQAFLGVSAGAAVAMPAAADAVRKLRRFIR
jgi:hypothetical protein